jgi:ABC-type dipeptide/oligopeptide/nickel transport system permease subunit
MEKTEKRLDGPALEKLGLNPEDIAPATAEEKAANDQMRPSVGYWKDAMQRFRRNKLAMVMLSILIFVILCAILIPVFSPYTYKGRTPDVRQGPSWGIPSARISWAAIFWCASCTAHASACWWAL